MPETPATQGNNKTVTTRVFAPSKSSTAAAYLPSAAHLPNFKNVENFQSNTSYEIDQTMVGATATFEENDGEDRDPSLAAQSSGSASDGRLSPLETPERGQDEANETAASTAAPETSISPEEQARRDEEASLELARAMMEEEAMASYAASYEISMDFLRNNQTQYSQEDLAALEAAMEEENAAANEEGEDSEDANAADVSGMSYDMMLRLGEQIGDVKLERWAQVAQQKIDALSTSKFDPKAVDEKTANDCDIKCLICQCQYEEGETLRTLPCGHAFHAESCVDQWLLTKDFCPYCRTSLSDEQGE
ncbi:MAG: hypothetical protein SGILL_004454 [Bacillariaceae sp.]